jgi:hypothetical protein
LIRLSAPLACAALLLLAACSAEPAPEPGEGAPMGEVLEGSISDEMIAYDRLRSQPPRAAPLPGEEAASGAPARPGSPAEGGAADAEGTSPGDAAAADEAPLVEIPPIIDGE